MNGAMALVEFKPEAATPRSERMARFLIAIQGVITVIMTMAILPIGVALVLVNAVLAAASHGVNRKLFAGFAIAGAAVALTIGLGLMAVSGSGSTQVTPLG